MNDIPTTADILSSGVRIDQPGEFFGRFRPAWQAVEEEVWKLETRQEYREPGNQSWEEFDKGNHSKALELLPAARSVDIPLYESLQRRNVAFVRCRPVMQPLTAYLQWELRCYEFNARHGEKIFFLDGHENGSIFDDFARHDFMVFDQRIAFVHDYDEHGEIRGGWELRHADAIASLRKLFAMIWGLSEDFESYLSSRGLKGLTFDNEPRDS